MPSAESEALALATREDGSIDLEKYNRNTSAPSPSARSGWCRIASAAAGDGGVASIETPEDWQRTVQRAAEDIQSGAFLIERIGGQRYLDPELMAVLYLLRR